MMTSFLARNSRLRSAKMMAFCCNFICILSATAELFVHFWSSASHRLVIPLVRLSTVGKQAFLVAGANMWKDLPLHVTSTQSLAVFRQHLETFLFSRSYPDILM